MSDDDRELSPGYAQLAASLDKLPFDKARRLLDDMSGRLNAASIDLLERQLAERQSIGLRTDPWTLARHLLGEQQIRDWPYTRFLASQVRKAVTLESRFQAWSLPAQVGKTTWLRFGLAWAMDRRPDAQNLYMTHSATLARETALFVRDLSIEHEGALRYELRPDVRRQDRWMTTAGGGLLATHVGGGSGFSVTEGGLCLVDDPLANWQAAHSATQRAEVWNEVRAVARLRLAEGAAFIMAHTRWHTDDPTGMLRRLADELGIEVEFVVLPMIAGDDDPLGRAPGEPLEPERYSLQECEERAAFLGSYLAAAMEQQDPQPEEGGEIRREWWQLADAPPEMYDRTCTSWDMKLKDKASGSYVVGQAWGRVGGNFWCFDQLRGQWTLRQTKVAIALLSVRHPEIGTHVIENTGNGPEVIAELRQRDDDFVLDDATASAVGVTEFERPIVEATIQAGMHGLLPVTPKNDKLVRARTHLIPKLEAGNVWLVKREWAYSLIDEAAGFPPKRGGRDDQVDTAVQAIARLAGGKGAVLGQGGARSVEKPSPTARSSTVDQGGKARILR